MEVPACAVSRGPVRRRGNGIQKVPAPSTIGRDPTLGRECLLAPGRISLDARGYRYKYCSPSRLSSLQSTPVHSDISPRAWASVTNHRDHGIRVPIHRQSHAIIGRRSRLGCTVCSLADVASAPGCLADRPSTGRLERPTGKVRTRFPLCQLRTVVPAGSGACTW